LSKFGTGLRLISLCAYAALLFAAIAAIYYFSDAGHNLYLAVDFAVLMAVAFLIKRKVSAPNIRVFLLACLASLFANFYLNTVFYKLVIANRGQTKAAEYVNQKIPAQYKIYALTSENNLFQFYTKRPIDYIPQNSFNSFKPADTAALFFVNQRSADSLKARHADFKVVKAFENYPRETILPGFINKNTRKRTLDSVYLITK